MNSPKTSANWLKNALDQLRDLDTRERAIQVQILELLQQIELRKAYSEFGYDGLYSFCIREMRWSESQTYQRIQAMRAIRAMPAIKTKIESGRMSLTTVAQVQVMMRQDQLDAGVKRTPEEKRQLFESFEGKTAREVKTQIAEMRGERIRAKLSLELDAEAEQLWAEVKAQATHRSQGSELRCFKMLMREWLENREPKKTQRAISRSIQQTAESKNKINLVITENTKSENANSPAKSPRSASTSRYIPAQIRRQILEREHYRCQNCGSRHALQLDHIQAHSKQGARTPDNLRTLCRNCNLHFAIKEFGVSATKRH